jgi:hypothetical protein
MDETRGRQPVWEDGPPPRDPAATSPPATGPAVAPPQPAPVIADTAAIPDAILAMLADQQRAASEDNNNKRTNTLILLIIVTIVLVVGSVVGAEYLKSAATGAGTGSGVAQQAVDDAFGVAQHYVSVNSYLTLVSDPTQIVALVPASDGISVSPAPSTEPQVVALEALGQSSLEFVALQPDPPACFGVLDVYAPQAGPIFSKYPETADAGVYYFVAPVTSPASCNAGQARPNGGAQYVSTSGFPSAIP